MTALGESMAPTKLGKRRRYPIRYCAPSPSVLSSIDFLIRRVFAGVERQGHTHGAGLVWNDYGAWSGETGCMCKMGDYTSDSKLRNPRPWCPGYVVTELSGGVTDINASRFVSL